VSVGTASVFVVAACSVLSAVAGRTMLLESLESLLAMLSPPMLNDMKIAVEQSAARNSAPAVCAKCSTHS